jgi:hypothetical protein
VVADLAISSAVVGGTVYALQDVSVADAEHPDDQNYQIAKDSSCYPPWRACADTWARLMDDTIGQQQSQYFCDVCAAICLEFALWPPILPEPLPALPDGLGYPLADFDGGFLCIPDATL